MLKVINEYPIDDYYFFGVAMFQHCYRGAAFWFYKHIYYTIMDFIVGRYVSSVDIT